MDRTYLLFLCWALVAGTGACHGIVGGSNGTHPIDGSSVGLAKCGNGQLEPGEACEGSNLSGSSCALLGFQSGTLSCAASCQFDTSACMGPLTLTVNPSRSTCTAPCAVFFDATGTTGLQNGDYVSADFNWDFDSTNLDPNGLHEHTIGFVTAHVFEVPGTYQVSVRVRDMAGHAGSTQVPISVSAMTGSTIYVAASGSDQNSTTNSTMTKPLATLAAALAHVGAATSILLRRGDTFKVGTSTVFFSSLKGPFLIGAYTDPASSSSTAAPIISSTASYSSDASLIDISNVSDLRVTDLHVVGAVGGFVGASIHGSSSHVLLERVEIEGVGNPPSGAGEGLTLDNTSNPVFFVDCHLHDFNGDGIYADRPTRFSLIGTTIEKFGGLNHGMRIQGGASPGSAGLASGTYIAENMIAPNTPRNSAFDASAVRGDNTDTVEVNNRMQRVISFTPTNDQELEHVRNVLVEGNVLSDNGPPNNSYTSISIKAQHIVVRNNVMLNPDAAVDVEGHPLLPDDYVDQIYVYNNTEYFYPASGVDNTYPAFFLKHVGTTGSVILENNIFSEGMTSQMSTLINGDGKGTEMEDHNLGFAPNVSRSWTGAPSGTGDLVGDPKFASTDVTNPSAFRLSAGSAAIDAGTMTPAYQDLLGVPRPIGAAWDIGAFEFASSSGAQDASASGQDAAVGTAAAIVPRADGQARRRALQAPAAASR